MKFNLVAAAAQPPSDARFVVVWRDDRGLNAKHLANELVQAGEVSGSAET